MTKYNLLAKRLNEFSNNTVSTLGITENFFIINEEYRNISDSVQRATVKFESHPGISLIKIKSQTKIILTLNQYH